MISLLHSDWHSLCSVTNQFFFTICFFYDLNTFVLVEISLGVSVNFSSVDVKCIQFIVSHSKHTMEYFRNLNTSYSSNL